MRAALLALGVILVTAAAWAALNGPSALHAQEGPRLATLEIDIWPEFDRRGTALVILRGKLADEVALPATLAFRIPASSGAPSAVASAASETATLLTLDYELADADDSLLLTLTTPDSLFHVEFYEPLRIDADNRSYTYVWPADLAVEQLSVEVQEPVGATAVSIEPGLGEGSVGTDQLVYHRAEMGAFAIGQTLTMSVGYVKADPRTSMEILGPVEGDSDGGVSFWVILVAAIAALVVVAGLAVYWRRQGRGAAVPAGPAPGARRGRPSDSGPGEGSTSRAFCRQCGERLRSGDRFCPQCGAAVKGK